jgi:hypothetical protein
VDNPKPRTVCVGKQAKDTGEFELLVRGRAFDWCCEGAELSCLYVRKIVTRKKIMSTRSNRAGFQPKKIAIDIAWSGTVTTPGTKRFKINMKDQRGKEIDETYTPT